MRKLVLRLGLMLVLVLAGLVIILGLSLDRVVRNGVITVGPNITQTSVGLEDVKLSLFTGSGELTGLVIGNPEPFTSPSAIDVGQLKLALQPRSVLSDKVVVRSIELTDPVVTLEGSLRGNNLSTLLRNIEESTGTATQPASGSGEGAGKKLQVDRFVMRGAKLNLSLVMLKGQKATVPLPDFELRDLGQGPEGITAAELSRVVLQAVLDRASAAASSYLKDFGGQLGESIQQGTDAGRKAANQVLDLLKKPQ